MSHGVDGAADSGGGPGALPRARGGRDSDLSGPRQEHQVVPATSAEEGLELLSPSPPHTAEDGGFYWLLTEVSPAVLAGEQRLAQLDRQDIPQQAAIADRGGGAMAAQRLRDLRTARDDLQRRIHDLRLTRQVTMQSLP